MNKYRIITASHEGYMIQRKGKILWTYVIPSAFTTEQAARDYLTHMKVTGVTYFTSPIVVVHEEEF